MAEALRICPVCGEKFDINSIPHIKRKNRYVHVDCFKKKFSNEEYNIITPDPPKPKPEKKETTKKPTGIKKCYYCKGEIDVEKEEYRKPVQNRYAHLKCYQENYKPDDEYIEKIYDYLGKELLIQYDFLQCEKQRIGFIKKNGYTNEGILLALKYFYEVKKQSADRSGNRIGIVPYVYDEAQTYYAELQKQKKKINKGLKKQLDKKAIVIKVKGEQKEKEKDYIDIDKIGG